MGISLEYPQDWAFEEDSGIGVVIFAEEEKLRNQAENPFAPAVNVIVHPVPPHLNDMKTFSQMQVARLAQMAPSGAEPKVDSTAFLGGHPAGKSSVNIPVDSSKIVKFFTIWTLVDNMAYSCVFNCDLQDFSKYQKIVQRLLASIKIGKPKPKFFSLVPLENKEFNFVFKHPDGWEALRPHEADGKGPLVSVTNKFKQDKKEYHRDVKVVTQKREGTLDDHVDRLTNNLKRMLVSKMDVEKAKLGGADARLIYWTTDAIEQGTRYQQVLAAHPTDANAPLIVLTMSTNAPADDDITPQCFDAIARSLRFTTEDSNVEAWAKWNTFHHLLYKFQFSFDGSHYILRDEGVQFTEAAFVLAGDDPENPTATLSVIVRKFPDDQKMDLKEISSEILENLKQICGPSYALLKNEELTQDDRPGRISVAKGDGPMGGPPGGGPPDPHFTQEMYFVHKILLDQTKRVAVLFAFTSVAAAYKKEWPIANSYIRSMTWF
jgi:hypothetical protein